MSSAPDESASFTPYGIRSLGVRADPTEIAGLRSVVRRWLAELPLTDDQRQDILLASYEALANAVEHAYPAGSDTGTLDLETAFDADAGVVSVLVADRGTWHDAVDDPARRSRGHGLTLIRNLASEVDVRSGYSGTVIEMKWVVDRSRG